MVEAKRILVVDDDSDVAKLLSLLLTGEGFKVSQAQDGQEALDKARQEKPDLLILDVMLPKLDGYKVARMLKFDEKFSHIPIIMLTAKIQEHDRELGLEMGADEYINKPFDNQELILKVKELVGRGKRG